VVSTEEIENPASYVNDEYWSYNNKFKLEIGVKNIIDDKYPDILGFN
jgi:hypothetical protein